MGVLRDTIERSLLVDRYSQAKTVVVEGERGRRAAVRALAEVLSIRFIGLEAVIFLSRDI